MTTGRLTATLALLTVAMLAACSTATAAPVEAFVGPPTAPDTTRTDTFAQGGFGFFASTLGTKQVNQLGFWVSPDNPGGVLAVDHNIALYNYAGASQYPQIAAATIPAGSTADANGYAWASIPALTLTDTRQGLDYYIVTASVGTDVWAPNTGSANVPTLDATFGTRTGNGWFSTTPAPGVGGTAGFNMVGGNGGYFGPNIGFEAAPPPADLITGVTIEDYSSQLVDNFDRQALHTVDGSGLTGGYHGNAPDPTMWLTHGTYRAPNDPLPAQITFDLEAVYDLDRFHVWNYNEVGGTFTNRGADDVTISVASAAGGPFTSLGNFNFAKADGTSAYAGETIDLSAYAAADNARLVRFDITSNHNGDADFAGLSEVQFSGDFVAEPPPPSGLVGYWKLDGNGAAVAGGTGALVNGPQSTTDRNGADGGGLAFDGASQQYVSVPGGGGLNGATSATVSMWVQWNGTQDAGWGNRNAAVLGRQNNGQWSDNLLALYPTTDPDTANINWEAIVGQGMNSGVQPQSGDWHHVAVTMGPNGEVFYVDGVPVANRGAFGGFHDLASIPLTIGAWIGDGASYSTGRIDDVAVWNQVLSAGQIAKLAAQTMSPGDGLIRPVGAQASSELIGSFRRQVANASDRAGHTTNDPDGWAGDVDGMWLSAAGDTTPTVTFDLGGVHAVGSLELYNYNELNLTSRGVAQAEILVSTDNINYSSLGTFDFDQATGNGANPGQFVSLGGVQARYVQLGVVANYGDSGYTGLNEVAFMGEALQPMPLQDVSVTASSALFEGNFDRRPGHLVDAAGLFADGHSAGLEGLHWLSEGVGFGQPGDDSDPELVFDLGSVASVVSARIWNYNEANFTNRGVQDLEILGSADGVDFTSLGTFTLAEAPGVDGVDYSEWLAINAAGVRFLKFDVLSNHNGSTYDPQNPLIGGDNGFVGLSEVRFYVPEPATIALFALGAVALVPIARRRRR